MNNSYKNNALVRQQVIAVHCCSRAWSKRSQLIEKRLYKKKEWLRDHRNVDANCKWIICNNNKTKKYFHEYFYIQLQAVQYGVLVLLFGSDLVKGGNYWHQQVFHDQHSRTPNPFYTAAATINNEPLPRFIIGQYSLPPNIIKITERVAVRVPYAQFIPVPHNVPYPFAVPISKPFPVKVPQFINFNQDTPVELPETNPHWPHAYGETEKIMNEAEIPSSTSHDKFQKPALQMAQQLLPPI